MDYEKDGAIPYLVEIRAISTEEEMEKQIQQRTGIAVTPSVATMSDIERTIKTKLFVYGGESWFVSKSTLVPHWSMGENDSDTLALYLEMQREHSDIQFDFKPIQVDIQGLISTKEDLMEKVSTFTLEQSKTLTKNEMCLGLVMAAQKIFLSLPDDANKDELWRAMRKETNKY